jgi:hypothetical protein
MFSPDRVVFLRPTCPDIPAIEGRARNLTVEESFPPEDLQRRREKWSDFFF